MEMGETHIGPANHIGGGPVETFKDRVFKNLIWQVDPKAVFEKSEAESNCAVFTPKVLERLHVQNFATFPVLSFLCHALDVILAVL